MISKISFNVREKCLQITMRQTWTDESWCDYMHDFGHRQIPCIAQCTSSQGRRPEKKTDHEAFFMSHEFASFTPEALRMTSERGGGAGGVGTIEKYNTFHSCVQLRPTMDNCCWIFLSRFMSSFIYIRTLFLVETIAKIRSPVLKNVQPLKKLPSFWFNICTCLHCLSIQKNFWQFQFSFHSHALSGRIKNSKNDCYFRYAN